MKPHLLVYTDRGSDNGLAKALVISINLLRQTETLRLPDARKVAEVYEIAMGWNHDTIIDFDVLTETMSVIGRAWENEGVNVLAFVQSLQNAAESKTIQAIELEATYDSMADAASAYLNSFHKNGLADFDIEEGVGHIEQRRTFRWTEEITNNGDLCGHLTIFVDLIEGGGGGHGHMTLVTPDDRPILTVEDYPLQEVPSPTGRLSRDALWHAAAMLQAVVESSEAMSSLLPDEDPSAKWVTEHRDPLNEIIVGLEIDADRGMSLG